MPQRRRAAKKKRARQNVEHQHNPMRWRFRCVGCQPHSRLRAGHRQSGGWRRAGMELSGKRRTFINRERSEMRTSYATRVQPAARHRTDRSRDGRYQQDFRCGVRCRWLHRPSRRRIPAGGCCCDSSSWSSRRRLETSLLTIFYTVERPATIRGPDASTRLSVPRSMALQLNRRTCGVASDSSTMLSKSSTAVMIMSAAGW